MGRTFDYDAELGRYHQRLVTAMDVVPDDQVLDIGCGTGLTTREAARRAVAGSAVGVDISAQMLATARQLSEEEGLRNVQFELADAQVHPFPNEHFSLGVSRFGTMFFGDPLAAFTNIGRALRPGARLVQLVWKARAHQEWDAVIRQAVGDGRTAPDLAVGNPFSLADPSTVERLLTSAGFSDLQLIDVHEPVYYGPSAEAACDAARALQLTRDLLADLTPTQAERALDRLLAALGTRHTPTGVWLDSQAWLITAYRS